MTAEEYAELNIRKYNPNYQGITKGLIEAFNAGKQEAESDEKIINNLHSGLMQKEAKEFELENRIKELETLLDNSEREKERLKGVIEEAHYQGYFKYTESRTYNEAWIDFKKENNL